MNNKPHWENVYRDKNAAQVSWYQKESTLSLQLIKHTGVTLDEAIIDIGSGASALVRDLVNNRYRNISVLDLAESAIETAKARLGDAAADIQWMAADITRIKLPADRYALWHDRAVFHFLVDPKERLAYLENLTRSVKQGGHVIIATFAQDGPEKCSGLPVERYSAAKLDATLGDQFKLISNHKELHKTPFDSQQRFLYCYFRKV